MPGGFVGRDSELRTLHELCLDTVADAVARVAFVRGEAGSGKSRLLAELRSLAGIGEPISIAGYEHEQAVPYGAARDLLRRGGSGPGPSTDLLSPSASTGPGPTEQLQLLEATHRAVESRGPAVIFIDDLQWADEASLSLIHYLVRAADVGRQPLVVVAASRPSPVAAGFAGALRRLLGHDRLLDIKLEPLSHEAATQLVGELAPHLDDARRMEIWRVSGGSPFWLELLATGEHADVDNEVADRLRSVSHDARALLAVLAVVAHPLPVEAITGVQQWADGRAEAAAAALRSRGLAAYDSGSVGIAHDLIREAIVRSVEAMSSRAIHQRYGEWLERHGADDDQSLLEALAHQHAGGLPVVRLAARLGESPRRRLLGAKGLRRLAEIADDSQPDVPEAMALRRSLASLAAELGQHEEALQRWSEYSLLRSDEPTVAADAALRASEAALQIGRPGESRRQLRRAGDSGGDDPVLRVGILAHEAALQLAFERDLDRSRIAAATAVGAARALVGDDGGELEGPAQQALIRALSVSIDVARLDDRPDRSLELAEELDAAATGIDDGAHIRALLEGAMALRFLGQNLDAVERLRRAWDEARRRVLPQATLEVGTVLGLVLMSLGEISEAKAVERECSNMGMRMAEFHPARSFRILVPHVIELTVGDWRNAVVGLAAAAEAERDPHYRQHAHRERAAALARLDAGNSEQVRLAVGAAREDAMAAGCRRCASEAMVRGAEAMARIGDVDAARSLVIDAEIPASDAHNGLWLRRAEAAILVATNAPRAAAALEAVISEAERQHLHLEALWARLDLGVFLAQSDRVAAVEMLRLAGAAAEEMGATTQQRLAEQHLRSLGVRTWRRTPGSLDSGRLAVLTEREREIADLVAQGASNPEIAATVFVSRKTVERHVSNVLAKLGVRNRAELAVLVADSAPGSPGEGVPR